MAGCCHRNKLIFSKFIEEEPTIFNNWEQHHIFSCVCRKPDARLHYVSESLTIRVRYPQSLQYHLLQPSIESAIVHVLKKEKQHRKVKFPLTPNQLQNMRMWQWSQPQNNSGTNDWHQGRQFLRQQHREGNTVIVCAIQCVRRGVLYVHHHISSS